MSKKRYSVTFNEAEYTKLKELSWAASKKADENITWSDLVHYTTKTYGKDAAKDLAHGRKKKEPNNDDISL